MQLPLQITFRNVDHSAALEAAIHERMNRLEAAYPTIVSCRVVVESVAAHKHQGKTYSIHIDLKVPRHEVAITRDREEDIFVAVREAFDAATRRLVESPAHDPKRVVRSRALRDHERDVQRLGAASNEERDAAAGEPRDD